MYDFSVDHASRTIMVTGRGSGSTADTLQLIADLQDTLRACPGYDMLYDSVELQIVSSAADLMQVADALFGQAGATLRRFAIVVPESRVQLARIFTALAHPHGVRANVFTEAADARAWLGMDAGRDAG